MTAIVDLFPHHLRRGYRKELFTAFVCTVWFLIGLSMVTEVDILSMLCIFTFEVFLYFVWIITLKLKLI